MASGCRSVCYVDDHIIIISVFSRDSVEAANMRAGKHLNKYNFLESHHIYLVTLMKLVVKVEVLEKIEVTSQGADLEGTLTVESF